MSDITDWVGALLMLAGVFFTLVAAIGMVTMKDTWSRMHAASKPQLLGLLLVCAGITVTMWSPAWLVLSILVVVMQVITAPVGSHLVARSIDRTERPAAGIPIGGLAVDDLADAPVDTPARDGSNVAQLTRALGLRSE